MTVASKEFVLYKYFDHGGGTPLYVGRTTDLVAREAHHKKTASWYGHVASVKYEFFDTAEELEQAEKAAIISERPLYNQTRYGGQPCSTAKSSLMWFTRQNPGYVISEETATRVEKAYLKEELRMPENWRVAREIRDAEDQRRARAFLEMSEAGQ